MSRFAPGLISGSDAISDSDVLAIIAAMTSAPDATRQTLINNLVIGIKSDGLWSKIGALYVPAAHDNQAGRVEWKNRSVATATGSPTFTTDRGLKGTSSAYWNGLSASAAGLSQNDAHVGAYTLEQVVSGADDIAVESNLQLIITSSEVWSYSINSSSVDTSATTHLANQHGVGVRTSSSAVELYINGASVHSASRVSTTVNSNGTRFGRSNETNLAIYHYGASMNSTELTNLKSRFDAYLLALGAI